MKIEAIDLFCGAGGLTRGLLDAGVKVKAGFDVEESCRFAYEENNKGAKFINQDVSTVKGEHLAKLWSKNAIRLLAGCAPCQPFSTAASASKKERSPDEPDPRYFLLNHFERLVRETMPELVTMENVPRVKAHAPFQAFVITLQTLGYSVWYDVVNCQRIGVPQTRRRMVLMASLLGPAPTGRDFPVTEVISVRKALSGLKKLSAGEQDPSDRIHIARNLTPINMKRMQASKPGGSWRDWPEELRVNCHTKETGATYGSVYSRMELDKPAPTMTTQFFNFGTGRFGHPVEDRTITPREAAIIQSFPADYKFIRDDEKIYQQQLGKMIGNAVPPKLGYCIGRAFSKYI